MIHKYRYVYGIPGKPETRFFCYFTLEEIESGKPLSFLKGMGETFKIISMDQFTGLKDKNGKEIYENDIVNGYNGESNVYFSSGSFKMDSEYDEVFQSCSDDFKITGNTHGVKV